MSATEQPSEQELRAAYEAEIKQIRVEQILLEQVVSLVNVGMRRTGLAPGTEDERDLTQVRVAIEAVRALLPVIEQSAPPQAGPIRDALSQLQLAFVRLGGSTSAAEAPAPQSASGAPGAPGEPAAAQAGGGGTGSAAPGADAGSAGSPPSGEPPAAEGTPGQGGPAQRSGRLWVPGQ